MPVKFQYSKQGKRLKGYNAYTVKEVKHGKDFCLHGIGRRLQSYFCS